MPSPDNAQDPQDRKNTRREQDALGPREVPADALYGIQTARAVDNFPIANRPMPPAFIHAIARFKRAAARVNAELGVVPENVADLIVQAADEVLEGEHADQFPVDVFQTGSGTSSNMNVNEVLANRAIQLAGGTLGSKNPVHPNDHVNAGQSSNDLVPGAVHLALFLALRNDLAPALDELQGALENRARAMDGVVKIGRTHLQDATPIRMGQVMAGYAASVRDAAARLGEAAQGDLARLALGGTAVGTGQNAHPEFARRVIARLATETGLPLREAENHCSAQSTAAGALRFSGELRGAAVALSKIANDIRFLASGPRCGLGELTLPSLQPGSSIMPGKVNPVLCESLMQAAAFVVGADAGVAFAAAGLSNFELSAAWPFIAWQLLESTRILAAATRLFARRAVAGLEADVRRCGELGERSLALATGLVPLVGYDRAARVALRAAETDGSVRAAARELEPGLDENDLDRALDARRMTGP